MWFRIFWSMKFTYLHLYYCHWGEWFKILNLPNIYERETSVNENTTNKQQYLFYRWNHFPLPHTCKCDENLFYFYPCVTDFGHDFFICWITLHFHEFQSVVIWKKIKIKIEFVSKLHYFHQYELFTSVLCYVLCKFLTQNMKQCLNLIINPTFIQILSICSNW